VGCNGGRAKISARNDDAIPIPCVRAGFEPFCGMADPRRLCPIQGISHQSLTGDALTRTQPRDAAQIRRDLALYGWPASSAPRSSPYRGSFFPQPPKHWTSTSLERDRMNVPANLLFDIELAKSRLEDAFKPATGSNHHQRTEPASSQTELSRVKTNKSPISRSFRLPEVHGCAGISFQVL
jgi:hypothetical protein